MEGKRLPRGLGGMGNDGARVGIKALDMRAGVELEEALDKAGGMVWKTFL